ncbi:hypothetical protein KP79_PYT19087 [Mizuhopecten yessoensis]|uniref:Uncharacterized protein n=1 Tax=Mizuhopecten yessoensis TaxID=6573 RepID=A0A210PWP2_MIZYE|nr:hypothetical protein KP79_PYT19087 [Mizuhopecten yessoensis]
MNPLNSSLQFPGKFNPFQSKSQLNNQSPDWGSAVDKTEKRPQAKENAVTQTNGQWMKKTRRQDRIHSELSRVIKEESRRTRRHRVILINKYRLKTFHIKNDGESKTKLMAGVNKKVVSLALEIDGLMNRVNEKRLILDRQREENKRVLQRYEQLYHDIQNRYMYE